MDLSEYLKSEYQRFYKAKKSFGYALNDVRKAQNEHRRMTRNTELFSKRQINEKMMSPYVTPGRKKTPKETKKVLDEPKLNAKSKRYEQLLAWKQEKEKRKQEQKQKVKPMFKVTHLPITIGLPDLENVNKQIKGKLFAQRHNDTFKFAPVNHKFRPPTNIKPLRANETLNTTKPAGLNLSKLNKVGPINMAKPVGFNLNKKVKGETIIMTKPAALSKSEAIKVTKPAGLNFSNSKRITRSQKAVLPILELPTRRRKLNLNAVEKIPNKVQMTKKIEIEKEKPEPKNMVHSSKIKKVTLSVEDESAISPKTEKPAPKNMVYSSKIKKVALSVEDESAISPKTVPKVYKKTPAKIKSDDASTNKNRRRSTRRNSVHVENCEGESEVTPKTISKVYNKTPAKVKGDDESTKKKRRSTKRTSVQTGDSENITKDLKSVKEKSMIVESDAAGDAYKTPTKSNRASMKNSKPRQSKSSSRKSEHSNKNQEDATISNGDTNSEICDSPKQTRTSTKQRRKSKNISPENTTHSTKSDEDVDEYITPRKNPPVVYISPFVTISRGKSSARKEYLQRKSQGGAYDSSPDIQRNTGPKAGAAYFQQILEQEIDRIQDICNEWANYKDNQNPPEEALDMINVAIGQSQLLISKKFKQFQGLINSCRKGDSEVLITCEDLHGYWDVAYIQVENLNKRFENLENLRLNNWKEILPQANKVQVKRKLGPKKPQGKVTSSLKDAIKAARVKAKSQNAVTENVNQPESTSIFDGKFFTITSPHKSPSNKLIEIEPPRKTPGHERKSLRDMVLSSEASKHKTTPGLNIIRASRLAQVAAISEGIEITPSKSILKGSHSVKKTSKSVLFMDSISTKINLNETYPPSISSDNDVSVLTNITNSDAKSTRTSKRRSSRNKF